MTTDCLEISWQLVGLAAVITAPRVAADLLTVHELRNGS